MTNSTLYSNVPMLMSIHDLQTVAGLNRSRAYEMLNDPAMPVVTIGRRKYMSRDGFIAWVEKQCGAGANSQTVAVH